MVNHDSVSMVDNVSMVDSEYLVYDGGEAAWRDGMRWWDDPWVRNCCANGWRMIYII